MTWEKIYTVCAAGVYGANWTPDNKLIVTSPDGYSITDPELNCHQLDRLGTSFPTTSGYIDINHYKTKEYPEPIEMFNWNHPIGKIKTQDNWVLKLIKNRTEEKVMISNQNEISTEQILQLERLEDFELSFSFSPNDKYFAIVGNGGAEIFKRKTFANKM